MANGGEAALEQVRHARPGLILLDVVMPGIDGYETCGRLKADPRTREIPVIFMTALSDTADIVRGFEAGAVDYVTKPFQREEVLARVNTHLTIGRLQVALEDANEHLERRVMERTRELREAMHQVEQLKNRLHEENVYLQEEIRREHHDFRRIVGKSPVLTEVLDQLEVVAPSRAPVLILGETGTGKELIARAIHDRSPRRERPLVKVNCSAISAGLVESELFGHVKGAFTGAVANRAGRFELADGGTLFLDEIGELALDTQVKLLRVLQEQEFEPVGSSKTKSVDVRVVAATNRDLESEVQAGRFRSDLYYRLNVLRLVVPPLRARRGDVRLLVDHFLDKARKDLGRDITGIHPDTMERLCAYDWPGNVRELQNVLERASLLSTGSLLTVDDDLTPTTVPQVSEVGASETSRPEHDRDGARADLPLPTLAEVERRHIVAALAASNGVIGGARGAAKKLGLHPNTLRSRMKKLGVERH